MPFELTATGDYRPITMPPTSAPRTPTVKVQGMDVPITTEAGQAQLKAMNPAGEAHDKFGANPTDFLPENVERGSVPLNDIKKYGFQPWSKDFPTPTHVKLKKLGKVMEEGEYTGWLRKFADAGQLDGPVWNPVTDEMIEPNRQLTANRSANPRKLDPSNAASIEIMQGFIKQARAIPDSPVDPLTLARQLAHEQGYIW